MQYERNRSESDRLHESWPLFERPLHFQLGYVLQAGIADPASIAHERVLARHSIGWWECDLATNALTWSDRIYDIFGLPRGADISRDEAVSLYSESSRAAMERLRSYAIAQRCGFTLDAEIRPATGNPRWMRLIGAPVCDGDIVILLHGLKLIL